MLPLLNATADSFTMIPQNDPESDTLVFWIGSSTSDRLFVYSLSNSVSNTTASLEQILVPMPGLIGYTGLSYNQHHVYALVDGWLVQLKQDGTLTSTFPVGLQAPHGLAVTGTSTLDVYITDLQDIEIWRLKLDMSKGFETGRCDDSSLNQPSVSMV